ncbi:MAG TPA: YidC/Oxa1 family membrane protein insertase [Candidatus Woesebacteria bacterium]|nr:YidC/Oxa1 family membrane protein insertase [Candidatus Woesebacteria bacterium]HPJ17329.1 YidC/Oxa1 family membrane protein insertase [Candidatus Woesebacteria bacterium]
MNIFVAPFVNALFGAYYLTGNLGWAIVLVTVAIKMVLLPLLIPSLKSADKMKELQPKLKKLQDKYGKDKEGLAKAQMDLYKQEGVNPMSGCLPQLVQIGVLIVFFSAFNMVTLYSEGKGNFDDLNNQLIPSFKMASDFKFERGFLGSDLVMTPAKIFGSVGKEGLILAGILLLGSGLLQYLSAKLMMPGKRTIETKATEDKEDDMMAAMRTQSLYMMPAMTVFIGWNFSLGMLLYWFVNSAVTLGQQLVIAKFKK